MQMFIHDIFDPVRDLDTVFFWEAQWHLAGISSIVRVSWADFMGSYCGI